ncbi:MAG: hypothetical protein AABX26_01790, partial [Nanoarchaeota archaeon]
SSYLMIDKFNVTNKTYRTMDNVTFPGLFVNASHIGNSVINASHLTAAMINATHIAISAVNSTHILDNTILAGDLNSDVNASIDLTHFTKAQWNVTNATYLPLYGGTMTGNLNMGNKTIENVFKLTINTGGAVDPPYKIGNITYATYVPSMTGIKEETSGTITLDGDYVIDFNNLENGSDLWLFSQITDFGKDWENLQVILTPGFEGNVWYTKDPAAKTLTIHGSKNGEVSYRMTSSRYDWANWGIIADEQIVGSGFEEIKKAQKPINDKELAKIEAAKKKK